MLITITSFSTRMLFIVGTIEPVMISTPNVVIILKFLFTHTTQEYSHRHALKLFG